MKNKIEMETYRFVGDHVNNVARKIENGRAVGPSLKQDSIIKTLNEHRKEVVGGTKLRSSDNSPRQVYMINFRGSEEEPKQMIKIIIDKENLSKGDPNALAVDGLCQYSVKVKHRGIALKTLAVTVTLAVGVGLAVGLADAFEKESKAETEKNHQYIEEINQARLENGELPFGLEIESSSEVSEEYSNSHGSR